MPLVPLSEVELMVRRKAAELFPNSPQDQARFLALAYQESGFNPSASATMNQRGDQSTGVFQFGPDMRRAYGLTPQSSAQDQVNAAGDYIQKLWQSHRGDWHGIAGEFNLGGPRYARYAAGHPDAAGQRFESNYWPTAQRDYNLFAPKERAADQVASPWAVTPEPQEPQPYKFPVTGTYGAVRPEVNPPDPNAKFYRAMMLANLGSQIMGGRYGGFGF